MHSPSGQRCQTLRRWDKKEGYARASEVTYTWHLLAYPTLTHSTRHIHNALTCNDSNDIELETFGVPTGLFK